MKFRVVGFGHREIKELDKFKDGSPFQRGESVVETLAELPEHIAWALWMDKCRYVTVEGEGIN